MSAALLLVVVVLVVGVLIWTGQIDLEAFKKKPESPSPDPEEDVPPPDEPEEDVPPPDEPEISPPEPVLKGLYELCQEHDECNSDLKCINTSSGDKNCLYPHTKNLHDTCVDQLECPRNLDCRVASSGAYQCETPILMEDLTGADQVKIPGTEYRPIGPGDKFFIRNRHKGRCLGRKIDDQGRNILTHSPVGPSGETIPCDISDPNFHWVTENIAGSQNKKYKLINTDLCLALNGGYRRTSSNPAGKWFPQSNFSIAPCTHRDVGDLPTELELLSKPPESITIDGQEIFIAPAYAIKTKSSTVPSCARMRGWGTNYPEASVNLVDCATSTTDTKQFNFPVIIS
jgi:hypothetical protein